MLVKLGLDNSEYKSKIKESESATTQSTTKMGSAVDKFGAKLLSAFSVAVIAKFTADAASKLLTFTADVDKAMREVSTISEAVANDFDGYKQAILDLSGSVSISAQEAAKALYQIVSAGYDGATALSVLEVSAKAAVGGVTDVATAADAITTLLNSYKLSADKATDVSDMLFTTVKLGKTTMGELGSKIAQVAPIAASFGIEMDQVLAAVATLTKSGTPTARAMIQIRASIIAATKVLGDGYFATHSLQEGLAEIAEMAGGSESRLRELVPEVEGLNAVLGMTGKNAATAAVDLDKLTTAAGATQAAFEQIVDYSDQFKMLGNNLLSFFERVSSSILKLSGVAAESLNKMFQFDTLSVKSATILDTFTKGLDNSLSSIDSTEAKIEKLKAQFADLYATYSSYDKGNPFMLQPAKITTNIGTEFEWTTTGFDATEIYEDVAQKMNIVAEKIKTLQQSIDDVSVEPIADIASGLKEVTEAVDSKTIDLIKSQISALKDLANVETNPEKIREYGEEIAVLSKELKRLIEARDTGVLRLDITPMLGDLDTSEIQADLDKALSSLLNFEVEPLVIPPLELSALQESLIELDSVVESAVSSFASSVGEALSDGQLDEDELKAVFITPFAAAATQFGSLLIAQGVALEALKSKNPWAMIIGGAALVALGSALSNSIDNVASSVDSGSVSTTDTFTGGYSSGTSSDIWSSVSAVTVSGEFRLDGNDLVASVDKTNSYNSR